tara:strand:+ start:169 stop:603 length:435 start_codon:yes stop_codon:yes gene_type:complete
MNEKIDKELGVVQDPLQQEVIEHEVRPGNISMGVGWPVKVNLPEEDMEKDYEYQRENFYKLVERGSVAIDGILELAKEGEHPRAYEVAGQLIKNVAEVTEKLGDLQEKMKRLKDVPDNAPKNVTNALFVGSTAELQKMIKGKNE